MRPFSPLFIFSENDKQKGYLIDAYVRLGCAQSDAILEKNKIVTPTPATMEATTDTTATTTTTTTAATTTATTTTTSAADSTSTSSSSSPDVTVKDVDATFSELQKWAEVTDSKVS